MRALMRTIFPVGVGGCIHRAHCDSDPAERKFDELKKFKARVLIGGAPAIDFKGVPATLRVSKYCDDGMLRGIDCRSMEKRGA